MNFRGQPVQGKKEAKFRFLATQSLILSEVVVYASNHAELRLIDFNKKPLSGLFHHLSQFKKLIKF